MAPPTWCPTPQWAEELYAAPGNAVQPGRRAMLADLQVCRGGGLRGEQALDGERQPMGVVGGKRISLAIAAEQAVRRV